MSITERTGLPEGFVYDPYSIEAMTEPLPMYELMREHCPVYYNEEYDLFCLSRFEDAWEMLSYTDNVLVASEGPIPTAEQLRRHNQGPVAEAATDPLMMMNFHTSPVYEQIRQPLGRPFRPGAIGRLEAFIREQTRARLDLLLPRGRFDLTRHYAGVLGATTICYLLRLPLTEAKYVLDVVNDASRTDPDSGGMDEELVYRMIANATDIVLPLVRARRKEGADGSWMLMDGMLNAEVAGRRLTDREIAEAIGVEVLVGGSETVPKVVGHGLWELQKRPEQMAAVRADLAANARPAWNEMLRFCAPAQHFMRTVNKPVTIGGQAMRPGQRVMYLTPACSRDPQEYGEDAHEFRWNRENKRLLSFGHGQHYCMGVHLANLEGTIFVEEFLRRVPTFEVDEANAVRYPSIFQWGWNELPISVPVD